MLQKMCVEHTDTLDDSAHLLLGDLTFPGRDLLFLVLFGVSIYEQYTKEKTRREKR
jgi:hypothetical protein